YILAKYKILLLIFLLITNDYTLTDVIDVFFFIDTATTEIYTLSLHDALPILNVDGMNIISNDGSNKLNRSRKARVSYKVQRTINASLNAATSTRAVSSNPNFVTRQKIEIIFG